MKKIAAFLVTLALITGLLPAANADFPYSDVPDGHWAQSYIEKATSLGIINGVGYDLFGLGRNIKRAEFAAMLCRLFGWQKVSPETPSFSDNADRAKWYYADIETALINGAVRAGDNYFRPEEDITREEMAVMLVRALGYDALADGVKSFGMPFADVRENVGYITIASDFGIITGKTPSVFDPNGCAKREEAAAMMVRLYNRRFSATLWRNAFYAISSYSQKDAVPAFDCVTFGWSRLEYGASGSVALNTSPVNGNAFSLPDGYETPVKLALDNGVKTSLNVYMSAQTSVTLPDGTKSDPCSAILLNADARKKAESLILSELGRALPDAGGVLYSGVTVDFEGMKGDGLKKGLNAFLAELAPQLKAMGKTLTVMVHPRAKNNAACFDAYDYRAIGELSDKVVLMAHDYAADTMGESMMSAGFTATPVTPFDDVYYALKAVTDQNTGVKDPSKIALALSIDSAGWSLKNGRVVNAFAMHPTASDLYKRLTDPATVPNYSDRCRNPYITYYDSSDDTQNVVWYEDGRSVRDKIDLARMFGVQGVSVWRLGLVPDYADPSSGREIHYNVLNEILK